MAKKGVCLASCRGELHPGPSGWIHLPSEALDFLTFQRAEQPEGIASPLWRPLSPHLHILFIFPLQLSPLTTIIIKNIQISGGIHNESNIRIFSRRL